MLQIFSTVLGPSFEHLLNMFKKFPSTYRSQGSAKKLLLKRFFLKFPTSHVKVKFHTSCCYQTVSKLYSYRKMRRNSHDFQFFSIYYNLLWKWKRNATFCVSWTSLNSQSGEIKEVLIWIFVRFLINSSSVTQKSNSISKHGRYDWIRWKKFY